MVATGRRLTAAASVEFEAVSLVSGSFSSTVAVGWVRMRQLRAAEAR